VSVQLAFDVLDENGPEPALQFQIVHAGAGVVHVRQVTLIAAE
jgi:hypothetical protein